MKNIILFFIIITCCQNVMGQLVFNIWHTKTPVAAPVDTSLFKDPLVYNVTEPGLEFFPADSAVANGTAVIICPGGGFYYLHIDTEGREVAKWLNKKGISAFVLTYTVIPCKTNTPVKERAERRKDTTGIANQMTGEITLAIADAKQAISYVRKHTAEFRIKENKIGIIGFSAGGTLAVAAAFDFTSDNKPDFVAPIYAYVPPSFALNIKTDTPPAFIAAATDDEYHLVPASINLYNKWLTAGHAAELHIYSKGGHGFGMNKHDQPSDTWIDRFGDWLNTQGLLNK